MKKLILSVATVAVVFIGCGGTSSSTTSNNGEGMSTIVNENIAKDNALNKLRVPFNGYELVVESNASLVEEPSMSTKAVYGSINGNATTSLLTINDNYHDGDTFVIKVVKNGKVVGQSDVKVLNGETLDFGNIVTEEK